MRLLCVNTMLRTSSKRKSTVAIISPARRPAKFAGPPGQTTAARQLPRSSRHSLIPTLQSASTSAATWRRVWSYRAKREKPRTLLARRSLSNVKNCGYCYVCGRTKFIHLIHRHPEEWRQKNRVFRWQ
jgi:hypothetical protein